MEERIAALERRLRRLTGISAMFGCACLVMVVWMFAPRPRLDAREFALRDSTGMRRAALLIREDGQPMLRIDDAQGRPRIDATVRANGRPVLRLSDDAWVHRLSIELGDDGRPRVTLADSTGRPRAQLLVDEAARGVLEIEPGSARSPRE